jgi:hypothetical protein
MAVTFVGSFRIKVLDKLGKNAVHFPVCLLV